MNFPARKEFRYFPDDNYFYVRIVIFISDIVVDKKILIGEQSSSVKHSKNYIKAFLVFLGRLFLLAWNFPLTQFSKIVIVYGSILNFIGYTFLNISLSYKYAAGFGLVYYLVFFEIPLLFRPERPTGLRVVAKEIEPTTTKERGRKMVEEIKKEEVKKQ